MKYSKLNSFTGQSAQKISELHPLSEYTKKGRKMTKDDEKQIVTTAVKILHFYNGILQIK